MSKNETVIRIIHKPSGELLAEGDEGWGMFAFEGNYYVANKNLKTEGFKFSGIPGICPYKFIYFWYHFVSHLSKTLKKINQCLAPFNWG